MPITDSNETLPSLDATTAPDLYTYVLVRGDLQMPAGKLASQAAHASAQSLLQYLAQNPSELPRFIAEGHSGSRVILTAEKPAKLLQAYEQAKAAGLPTAIFEDEGHILAPHFDGRPILTALAIGPAPRPAMREITKRFQCVR